MAAEEVAAEEVAAEEVASEEMAAEEVASEEMAAEEVASEEMAAEEVAPEEVAHVEQKRVFEDFKAVCVACMEGDIDRLSELADMLRDRACDVQSVNLVMYVSFPVLHNLKEGRSEVSVVRKLDMM